MYKLLSGIQSHFNAQLDLLELFPNGCYLTLAPYQEPLPTCVLTVVSAVPSYETDNDITVVYSVIFTVRNEDGDAAIQAVEVIKSHFDFADFNLQDEYGVGPTLIECRRVNETTTQEDERVAAASVTYQITIEESLT